MEQEIPNNNREITAVLTDLQGREYAKIKDVKEGNVLETDGHFTCMRKGEKNRVYKDPNNELFLICDDGRHYLDGQKKDDYYLGMYS